MSNSVYFLSTAGGFNNIERVSVSSDWKIKFPTSKSKYWIYPLPSLEIQEPAKIAEPNWTLTKLAKIDKK